jgi:uncharacterized protein YjeT (DUF2065 family)
VRRETEQWRMEAWREGQASMERAHRAILTAAIEYERRELRARALVMAACGVIVLWVTRRRAY